MPTYEYKCRECGHTFEIVQSFSAKPLKKCKECGGQLGKVFGNIGISFKGSGFYRTDSKNGSGAPKPRESSETKSESSSKDKPDTKSSSDKSDKAAKPASGSKKESAA